MGDNLKPFIILHSIKTGEITNINECNCEKLESILNEENNTIIGYKCINCNKIFEVSQSLNQNKKEITYCNLPFVGEIENAEILELRKEHEEKQYEANKLFKRISEIVEKCIHQYYMYNCTFHENFPDENIYTYKCKICGNEVSTW